MLFNTSLSTLFAHHLVLRCVYMFCNLQRRVLQMLAIHLQMLAMHCYGLCVAAGTHGSHHAFASSSFNTECMLKMCQECLSWANPMCAKPTKCIASGLVRGLDPSHRIASGFYSPRSQVGREWRSMASLKCGALHGPTGLPQILEMTTAKHS